MHPIYSRLENRKDGERAERYERDIRNGDDEYNPEHLTAREIRFLYEAMKGDSGKEPFITTIAPCLQVAAVRAIRYFTNTDAIIHGVDHHTGRVIIQSLGQK